MDNASLELYRKKKTMEAMLKRIDGVLKETIYNSEGNQEETSEASDESPSTSDLRVRMVAEINESANMQSVETDVTIVSNGEKVEHEGSPTKKRKLPSWMMTQTTCDRAEADDGASTSSAKKPKIAVNDGTSAVAEADEIAGTDAANSQPEPSCATNDSNDAGEIPDSASPLVQIKNEPAERDDEVTASTSTGMANPTDVKPAIKVEKADASSTSRESCKFGIRCYRRNQMHRIEEAHPGDHDYKRPSYPPPPKGTPDCPYGDSCYRRNPVHFQQYNHPPETDFEQNYKNYRMRLRQRKQQQQNNNADDGSDLDEYDLNDPFIDDDDDDEYVPSDDEEDTEEFYVKDD